MDDRTQVCFVFFKAWNYFTENTTYLIKQEIIHYCTNLTPVSFYTTIFPKHTFYF